MFWNVRDVAVVSFETLDYSFENKFLKCVLTCCTWRKCRHRECISSIESLRFVVRTKVCKTSWLSVVRNFVIVRGDLTGRKCEGFNFQNMKFRHLCAKAFEARMLHKNLSRQYVFTMRMTVKFVTKLQKIFTKQLSSKAFTVRHLENNPKKCFKSIFQAKYLHTVASSKSKSSMSSQSIQEAWIMLGLLWC